MTWTKKKLLTKKTMTMNKAGYTAQDALSTRLKITGDGRTDGRTDTTSYRAATAHLKTALPQQQ